jgi:exosortase/archaeosortase family protein
VKIDLARVEALLRRHATVSVLAGLLLVFAGVDLLLNPPKGQNIEFLGVPFLVAGLAVFALLLRKPTDAPAAEARRTLASRFLDLVTLRGRLVRWFPIVAIAVIAADLAYNQLVFGAISLGTEDTSVLLFAAALFAYPFVPRRFGRERDFVLAFMAALILILVVPLLLARLFYQDFERSVDVYSWTALAPQTAGVLNLLGVPARVHAYTDPFGNLLGTAPALTFMTRSGVPITVAITTACSGIYSFGIFASAFVAFVLTEFERFRPKVLGLLALGFLTSYAANVLRMVLIVLFGAYSDSTEQSMNNLILAHSNLGWIIFLAWIALFWGLVFRFVVRKPADAAERETPAPRKHGVLCGICADALTPALPGYRCECGKFYHVACAATVEECPRCHRPMKVGEAAGSPASP